MTIEGLKTKRHNSSQNEMNLVGVRSLQYKRFDQTNSSASFWANEDHNLEFPRIVRNNGKKTGEGIENILGDNKNNVELKGRPE